MYPPIPRPLWLVVAAFSSWQFWVLLAVLGVILLVLEAKHRHDASRERIPEAAVQRDSRWRGLAVMPFALTSTCAAAALAAMAAGCGRGGLVAAPVRAIAAPQSSRALAHPGERIELRDQAPYFQPAVLRVPVGAEVVWENFGPSLAHTVHFTMKDQVLASGRVRPGESWRYRFPKEGTYHTQCEVHPFMSGVVIVESATSDTSVPRSNVPARLARRETLIGDVRIVEFALPVANSVPGILAIDATDNVWFTMGGGGWAGIEHPPLSHVGRIDLKGEVSVLTLPTPGAGPSGLVIDAGQRLYVTELMSGKIAWVDPQRQEIKEFAIPTPTAWPTGLALDQGGNLWFSETKGNKIGRLSTNGTITEIPLPTPNARPTGMVIDQEGRVWFSERDGNKIGRIGRDGTLQEFTIPTPNAKPTGMTVDADGRIWFAEREGNKLGMIDASGLHEYPLPHPQSGPFFPIVDDDGFIWFSETFGNRIGRLDPATGAVTEYELPTPGAWPGGLGIDSQGNIWFTEQLANQIGVILNPRAGAPKSGLPAGKPAPSETLTRRE